MSSRGVGVILNDGSWRQCTDSKAVFIIQHAQLGVRRVVAVRLCIQADAPKKDLDSKGTVLSSAAVGHRLLLEVNEIRTVNNND